MASHKIYVSIPANVQKVTMLIDYHIHTAMSRDAKGDIADYVKIARVRNLTEIGFSDHFHLEKKDYSMKYEKLGEYVQKVRSYKNETDFSIKLGLEVDFIPGLETEIRKLGSQWPFDYFIGSVHFINNWGFDDPRYISEYKKWDIAELNRIYYSLIQRCARSKLFDVIGHVDLIKKFGYKPKTEMTNVFAQTVEALRDSKVCVEVNTGGLRAPCREIYPSKVFVEMCFDNGIPITLGSDAHTPEDVGKDFGQALKLIREAGYRSIARFTHRKLMLAEI